jgi:SNF2 family DNA or RNA helicase
VWGGLLAEQMGLGKTLEVTALVLADKAEAEAEAARERARHDQLTKARQQEKPKTHRTPLKSCSGSKRQQSLQQLDKVTEEMEEEDKEAEADVLVSSAATLVVAPLSLLSQV